MLPDPPGPSDAVEPAVVADAGQERRRNRTGRRRRTSVVVVIDIADFVDPGEERGLSRDDGVRLKVQRRARLHQRREHRLCRRRGSIERQLVQFEQVSELVLTEVPERNPALCARFR